MDPTSQVQANAAPYVLPPPETVIHEVRAGETVDQIAARYSVPPDALLEANPGLRQQPDLIQPGQRFEIPLAEAGGALPGLVEMRSGQSLETLAQQTGRSVDSLMQANGVYDSSTVGAGDGVWIPDASAVPLTPDLLASDAAAVPYNTQVEPLSAAALGTDAALRSYRVAIDDYRAVAADPTLRDARWEVVGERRAEFQDAVREELDSLALATPSTPGAMLPGSPLSSENLDTQARSVLARYVNDPAAQQAIESRVDDIRLDLQAEALAPAVRAAPDAQTFQQRLDEAVTGVSPGIQQRLLGLPGIADRVHPNYRTPEQIQALAERYNPVLVFHPDERNGLEDPNRYIQESELRKELDWRPDERLHAAGDIPMDELAAIPADNIDADATRFLDHGDGNEARAGDAARARSLYEYDAESRTLTYHQFYAYNDGPGPQNHEGDWEAITIQLDADFKPSDVYFSGHGGAIHREWGQDMTLTADGRPISFVALGTHANRPEPGSWATSFPGVNDVVAVSPESQIVDFATLPTSDVRREAYYGSGVLWGERGSAAEIGVSDTSGPTGPSADKLKSIVEATRKPSDHDQPTGSLLDELVAGYRELENLGRDLRSPFAEGLDQLPLPRPLNPYPG